jgi:hypothetical protein
MVSGNTAERWFSGFYVRAAWDIIISRGTLEVI